ncbi:MAG TPA: HAD family hydrolase [Kiritimatiellia bacterium]|nr:HAD family hydrolase [Kiritimatiellia bacterium]
MTFSAVIFDLDGTLIDSIRDIGEAMNRTLEALGYPVHDLTKYPYLIGDGVRLLVQRALPPDAQTDDKINAFLVLYRKDYGQNWRIHTHPYPGIKELLNHLVSLSIPIGVLSNKPDRVTIKCVEYFFPDIPFVAVSGQKDDVPRKPDPTAALEIAEAMNVKPSLCVFVGDTSTDMQTAVAAGMFPAGVTWGFRDRQELLEHGARFLAYTPNALLGLFQDKASVVEA